MTIFFDEYRNTGFGDTPVSYGGEEIGLFEAMGLAYESQVRGSNIDTFVELMREELQPVIDTISERQDIKFLNPGDFFGATDSLGGSERAREYRLNEIFNHLENNRELYPEFMDLTRQSLEETIKTKALKAIDMGREARARENTLGTIGGFIGQAGGIFDDRAFLELMTMTGPAAFARTGPQTLGRRMLGEAMIGAGVEAVLQPGVKEWYDTLGIDYSYSDMLANIAAGGIIGAALPPVIDGGVAGVRMTSQQVSRGLDAFRGNGIKPKDADIIQDILEDFDELENAPSSTRAVTKGKISDEIDDALDAFDAAKEELKKARDVRDDVWNKIDDDLDAGRIDANTAKRRKLDSPEQAAWQIARQKAIDADKAADDAVAAADVETVATPEGADADIVKLIEDLNKGVDDVELEANPAVVKAQDNMMAIPETVTNPNYGEVSWDVQRQFQIVDKKTGETEYITGYEKVMDRLYQDSKSLAWRKDKLPVPDNPVKFEKKAIIILGPPASGKSSIANPIARKHNAAIIDSDEAKKLFPEFSDGAGANAVHKESKVIAEVLQTKAIDQGMNVVIPTVGSKPDVIAALINKFKANGFEVDLVGMDVSYLNARNRMLMRFVDTGRYIPLDYIQSIGNKPLEVYNTIKKEGIADGYTQIDNNGKKDQPKPVIEDTRQLLEGTDLRLREGRPRSDELPGDTEGQGPQGQVVSDAEEFIEKLNKADQASENLKLGNLPDDIADEPQRRSLPQERVIKEQDVEDFSEQVSRDTDFENIADDETFQFDEIIDDQVVARTYTGAQVKAELAQDQQMLDRLRGCVV